MHWFEVTARSLAGQQPQLRQLCMHTDAKLHTFRLEWLPTCPQLRDLSCCLIQTPEVSMHAECACILAGLFTSNDAPTLRYSAVRVGPGFSNAVAVKGA